MNSNLSSGPNSPSAFQYWQLGCSMGCPQEEQIHPLLFVVAVRGAWKSSYQHSTVILGRNPRLLFITGQWIFFYLKSGEGEGTSTFCPLSSRRYLFGSMLSVLYVGKHSSTCGMNDKRQKSWTELTGSHKWSPFKLLSLPKPSFFFFFLKSSLRPT